MNVLHNAAGIILILSAIFMVAGIIRPMIVLWGTGQKTRARVLMIYGVVAVLSGLTFMLTSDRDQIGNKDAESPREVTGTGAAADPDTQK